MGKRLEQQPMYPQYTYYYPHYLQTKVCRTYALPMFPLRAYLPVLLPSPPPCLPSPPRHLLLSPFHPPLSPLPHPLLSVSGDGI